MLSVIQSSPIKTATANQDEGRTSTANVGAASFAGEFTVCQDAILGGGATRNGCRFNMVCCFGLTIGSLSRSCHYAGTFKSSALDIGARLRFDFNDLPHVSPI